jgi:hypothetical protein
MTITMPKMVKPVLSTTQGIKRIKLLRRVSAGLSPSPPTICGRIRDGDRAPR